MRRGDCPSFRLKCIRLRGSLPPSSPRSSGEWQDIRYAYEATDEPVLDLCARHGLSVRTLYERARIEAWTPRHQPAAVDRIGIINRMFSLLDRQILHLERNMTATGEKEVAVLGKLASTLEKLIDIENASAAHKAKAMPRKDITDLRNKLAERIEQLKRA